MKTKSYVLRALVLLRIMLVFLGLSLFMTIHAQTGNVTWEAWKNKPTSAADLPTFFDLTNPTVSGTRADLCFMGSAVDWGSDQSDFVYRMSGYIFPTESGLYTFYSASDDDGEFWLNLNGAGNVKTDLTKVAWTQGWAGNKDWANGNNHNAGQVTLEAGKPYYFVAFFREGNGGDGLTLGWKTPSTPSVIDCIGSANISTLASSAINISAMTLPAGNLQQGSGSQILQKISLAVTQSDANLTGITLKLAGDYITTDIGSFKLWYNPLAATLAGATQVGSTIISAASGSNLAFSGFNSKITFGSTGYLILTANITAGATIGKTINITSTAFSNLIFNGSTVLSGTDPIAATSSKSIIAGKSKLSDIVLNTAFTSPSNIDYTAYTSTYSELAQFNLRDGGTASADGDAASTTLNELGLNVSNSANLYKIALFDGATIVGEVNAASIVTFSGLSLAAAQGTTKMFSLKVMYKNIITDNLQNVFTVASAIADGNGSGFAAANAGGTVTPSATVINKAVVNATKLSFTTQPSVNALYGGAFLQPAVVSAQDANGSTDVDHVTGITLSNSASLPMQNNVVNPVNGVAAFTSFNIPGVETNITLTATSGSLTAATSNPVSIFSPIAGSDNNPGDMGNDVLPGSVNQRILRITVKSIATVANPVNVTQIVCNLGSTTNAANIKVANLYSLDQWGNTVYTAFFNSATVLNNKLTFTGQFTMTEIKDYTFDLFYDIQDVVTNGDKLDAAVESATIDGVVFIPTSGNGTKERTIVNQGLTGIVTVDNTLTAPVARTSYKDFRTMLGDLNKYGVGDGGVTVVVQDDQTFSYINNQELTITQTGRPGCPLVFRRSGTGTNPPLISKQRGGSYYNYFMVINNARYLTFDGLNFKGTDGDGDSRFFTGLTFTAVPNGIVESVEIKNCTIDLDVVKDITDNSSRFGGAGVRIAYSYENAFEGAQKNIKIHNNKFLNLRKAVTLERRNGKLESIEIYSNTITNAIGTGIDIIGGDNKDVDGPVSIHDNEITGTSIDMAGDWGGNYDMKGIFVRNAIGNVNIFNNKIHNLVNVNALSRVFGIEAQGNNDQAVFNIYNNMIWKLSSPNSTSGEACNAFGLGNKGKFNLYYNSALLKYATSAANNSRIVLTYSWEQPQVELINNIFVNKVQVSGSAKAAVLDIDPARISSASDNNLYYAGAPGANNLINLNANKASLADYQAQVAGKELNSISDTVAFISDDNLHIRTDVVTKVESSGKPITTPFAITLDIDGDTRNSVLPDLGADEGTFMEYFVNHIPTITSVPKPTTVYTADGQQTVTLTGISDGDPNKTQNVTVTAVSSDNAIVRIDVLNYVANAATAALKYTPLVAGSATITVTVKDNGGIANGGKDQISISFLVTAEDAALNNAPTINAVADLKVFISETSRTVNLSGISDGDRNKVQNLVLTAYTDNNAIVKNLLSSYVSGDPTATLTFAPGVAGIATVFVRLKDDGGIVNNGVDTVLISFKVEVKEANGTAFLEDYNDNVITRWYGGSYGLTEQNQELKITPVKNSVWDGFGFSFPEITIKDAPYVSLKIKSNFDFNISMAVGKVNGKIDNYPLRIETIGLLCVQEIVASNEFQEYSFDYTGLPVNALDSVSNLHFVLNPLTRDFGSAPNKEIYFDDIKIGSIALHTPAIVSIPDQVFTVKTSGTETRKVNFRNVTDGSTNNNPISISTSSSNPACILDPLVNYTSPKRTGSLVLSPDVSAAGESVVSVIVSAPNTSDKVMTFKVKVVPNAAPTMKALPDMLVKKGELINVPLDMIDDGNRESTQNVTITATSSDIVVIPSVTVQHEPTNFTGLLSFSTDASTPAGTLETITVKLKDDGGTASGGIDETVYSFNITVYDEINHKPVFDSITPKSVKALAGSNQFNITGINDGDKNLQNLTFEVTASTDSVLTNLVVGSITKGVASLSFDLSGKTGTTVITFKVTDDGGNAGNNGNLSSIQSFVLTAVPVPLTGLIADYKPFIGNAAASGISNDQFGGKVELLADGTVHLSGTVMQQSFPSIRFILGALTGGKELDISQNKYVSFKFKGASTTKIEAPENKPLDKTKIFFRLIDNISPGQPGSGYLVSVIELNLANDDQWHDIYLDFNGLFLKTPGGNQTDSTRISQLMLDINDLWFQQIKGDYYFKDLKLGDLADRPLVVAYPTLNPIPNQVIYTGQTAKPVQLTGITDGLGKSTTNLKAITNKPSLVSNLTIGSIINGTSILNYTLNSAVTDTIKISVIATNVAYANSVADTVPFKVYVVDKATMAENTVTIDFSKTYQTMAGLGTMLSNGGNYNQIQQIKDQNITVMRFTSNGEFEPVNDNSDSKVSDYSNFNRKAVPTDIIREINETTNCHKFFFTPWSPPTWMKMNKGSNPDPAAMWAGNNKLMPEMYEEFAEYLTAICKTVKEEAGVELYAISLQNEPTFNEPYASCVYTGAEFRDIMKILGPRLEAENLHTRIMMPEDIATMLNWVTDKVNPVVADPEAAKYLGIMAVHLYDPDGINVGGTGSSRWNELLAVKKTTQAEGMWMTETSGFGNVWEGYWGKDYMSGNPQFFPGPLDFAGSIFTAFKAGNISGWTDFDGTGFKNQNDLLGSVFKNYSAYINPGSVMVDAISANSKILSLAFKNADNSVTSVLLNTGKMPLKVSLKGTNVPLHYRAFTTQDAAPFTEGANVTDGSIVLPPRSITTLYHSIANLAPTLDQAGNMFIELAGGDQDVALSGISYGADITTQEVVSVTAVSANASVANASVAYTAGTSTATLKISPVSYGTSIITVKVKDNGGVAGGGIDTLTMKFYITVLTKLNHEPMINAVAPITIPEDSDSTRITLSGISDGDNGTQLLSFVVNSSDLDLVRPRISYTDGSNVATLVFKPVANKNGPATFSLMVTDNGGDVTNNGNLTAKLEIPVTVLPVNDAPVITANVRTATVLPNIVKRFPITVDDSDPEVTQLLTYELRNPNPDIVTAYIAGTAANGFTLNVTGKKGGVVILTFVLKDNGGTMNGGVDTTKADFTVTIQSLVGIEENEEGEISIYPNPANNFVNVKLGNEHLESIVISDMTGHKVLQQEVVPVNNECRLSLNDLGAGIYFITVKTVKQNHTFKLIHRK